MWPQTLQLSEDDCRSTLRRLELETYANVIGVFRAQGGLNDKKAKLLEELRSVFHISQDRHRAEARRVANDEHLSTIAKVVSGPNTWQEWSREGRRAYPMLPRVAPQTALGWIANNLASEAALENAKLPYPAETAAAAMEEQASILVTNAVAEANGFRYPEKYVVTSDPFKMPDIPAVGAKKNLKRGMNDAQQSFGLSSSKKRNTNESSSLNKQKNAGAIASASATSNSRKVISMNRLHQQRFFYQQQQKSKKLVKVAGKREKHSGLNKSGRKSKKLKEQLNQQLIEEDELFQHEYSESSYENQFMQQLGHLDPSTNNAGIMDDIAQQQHQNQHIEVVTDQKETSQSNISQQKSFYLPLMIPQIAASKRDITRNLTKLQIPGQVTATNRISGQLESVPVPNQTLNSPSASSQIVIGNKAAVDGKLAQLSTPVQKYIVEDRQPPITGGHHVSNVASPSICPSTQQGSTSQYMPLPHLSTPNKLRTLNTSILPPGTKLSTSAKKLGGATILSATVLSPVSATNTQLTDNIISNANTNAQLYSLVDGGGGGGGVGAGNNASNSSSNLLSSSQQQILSGPSAPTHAPPAVIQLHSNEVVRVGSQQSIAATSTQSKVLTTKILPIVLSGNNPPASFTKGDPSSKNGSPAAVSSANFITSSSTTGSTIIKGLPSSLFVSSQHTGMTSSSPVFSSFGSTGPVYRKHPNILKSSSSSLSRNSLASSGGPKIISNIRLTPAITTGTTTTSSLMQQTQSGIFQQPIRAGSTTSGIRTSVKICQSPNGKVFIQPANVDTSKLAKLTSGHIPQRILPGALLGSSASQGVSTNVTASSSGSLSSNQPGSPHRIAIQKVQIIPAPLSGSTLSNTAHTNQTLQQHQHQQQQHRLGTTSLTIGSGGGSGGTKGSFSGNIFMPTSGSLRSAKASGPITLTKATFSNTISGSQNDLLSGSQNVGSLVTKQHSDMGSKASNVVVIDATNKIIPHHTKLSSNISRSHVDNSQMITEDTPVDIIVDNSPSIPGESSPVNERSSITAVLASNVLDNAQQTHQKLLTRKKQGTTISSSPTMVPITVLNATDWEMELDQATAASLSQSQQSGDSVSRQYNSKLQHPAHLEQTETAETIIIDDSFEDVIIEEEEQDETNTDNEHYDEQEQQDMDIEISNDSEIIMVDNLANFDERIQSESEKGLHELKKVKKDGYNTISHASDRTIDEFMGISSEDDDTTDLSTTLNVRKTHENIDETTDTDYEPEPALVSNMRNLTEFDVSKAEDIIYNNHEENTEVIRSSKAEDHTCTDKELNDSTATTEHQTNISESKLICGADDIKDTVTTEKSKTMVSASLFSVKDVQVPTENISKVEGDQESSVAFDVSLETHCSSKKDSVHASDQ